MKVVRAALAGAALAASLVAIPMSAQAAEVCPESWTAVNTRGLIVYYGAPVADAAAAMEKRDKNVNSVLCAIAVDGAGNTGAGVNVKDDTPEDLAVTFVEAI